MTFRINQTHHADILRRHNEGQSLESIANVYNRKHWRSIYDILRKMGVNFARKPITEKCPEKGCDKLIKIRGYCQVHYMRLRHAKKIIMKFPRIRGSNRSKTTIKKRNGCDHSTNRCECINPGKYHHEYLAKKLSTAYVGKKQ